MPTPAPLPNQNTPAIPIGQAPSAKQRARGRADRQDAMLRHPTARSNAPFRLPDEITAIREHDNGGPIPQGELDQWDPLNVLTGDYDPDAFYTNTSLGDEGTTQVSVTVSRSVAYLIRSIVQSGAFPDIRVDQDAFRDGIHHWLQRRSSGLPDHMRIEIERRMRISRQIARQDARRRHRAEVKRMVDEAREMLEQYKREGDREEFKQLLDELLEQLPDMRGPHKDKLEGHVEWGRRELRGEW